MKIFYIARSISFLFTVTICCAGFTQTSKLRFEHPSVEKGLRNINIQCSLQDSEGYLWFGTNNGLVKYDGYNFIYYKHIPYDTTSLIDNWIISLWEDKDGIIWIGTAESGLSKFDRGTGKFTQYRPQPDSTTFVPPFRAVSAINEDNYGTLWAGNWLGELRRFNKQTGTFFPEKYDLGYRPDLDTMHPNNTIFFIFKDRAGILWVGDFIGLHKLNIIPGKRNQPPIVRFTHYRHNPHDPNSVSSNMVTSIFEDHKGMFWIGTGGWEIEGGGLNRLDPKTDVFTHFQHDAKDPHSISSNTIFVQSIAEDTAGSLWVGTYNGLNKLNKDRTQFTSYFNDPSDPESIGGNFTSSLLIDRSHILWVGVNGAGLDKIDPNQKPFAFFRHDHSNNNSLSNDVVTSIYGDNSGIIWIGTAEGGLDAFNPKTRTFTHYHHSNINSRPLRYDRGSLVLNDKDSDGNFWVYFRNLWSLFNSTTGKFTDYSPNSGPFQEIYKDNLMSACEDSKGLLWLGTTNGLKRFDRKTSEIIHYRHDPNNFQSPADNTVIAILEDSRGNLWMGHNSVGVTKLNMRTGVFTHYLPNVSDSTTVSSPVIFSIYEDSKRNLWFGTKGGGLCLFNYEKETFTTYSEKQGLANNNIISIQEDSDGNLWLGTEKGISRFSPVRQSFMNYDAADGLPGNINSSVCFSSKDGALYYGGNGLTAFDPRQLKPNPYIPPVVITQFTLFDKPVVGKNEADEIILNHNENFFSFEFSALNYTNPSKNQYAYQLVGIDNDWVYSGNRRLASYTNIAPGDYVFRVKASNNDGIWNENGTSVRIIIRPPWWRTTWAYAFYSLCFLAGVFAIDRYQRRRLIRRERERTRERELAQAREIEKAYTELKATQAQLIQSEKMASLGELTAGIAHEIQNPLNFVNNFSDINKELLDEMKEEMDKGNIDDAKAIASDVIDNEEKINHHGKRADAIVKGMLQHSQKSAGQKEPTDINKLADEYLRLSYHGLRAKDKDFNADIKTEFDETIGKINIIPQDIGRVLLNLYNNSFYAVNEKNKQAEDSYQPMVSVITKKINDKVEIRVTDNGNGIPQKIVDKIFQPFFTTKQTGQGTGLGLSLSYDIVRAHAGEIKVETKEGEGAEFVIQLSIHS